MREFILVVMYNLYVLNIIPMNRRVKKYIDRLRREREDALMHRLKRFEN